jgi:hypothetical protein
MEITRVSALASQIVISGRDLDTLNMGIFVRYLVGDNEEAPKPSIFLPSNTRIPEDSHRFVFEVRSVFDIEIFLYDASMCRKEDVQSRHEHDAQLWIDTPRRTSL